MLQQADNEILCRVGPGTPMGNLMRQYWVPAVRPDELPRPDCPPLRVKLLGEDLIAFRTTSGVVGLIRTPALTAAPPCSSAAMRKRAALRLSRLEVRRRRRCVDMPVGARRVQLQEQGSCPRLPMRGALRHRLDLYGRARDAPAAT